MASVSKETAEISNSAQPSALPEPASHTKTTAHSRSDVVSLEVPMKVHGSRYASGEAAGSQTERFEEQSATMIVFPEGGVLRMMNPVGAGQMLVLTNMKSRQDAICRVVKVRNFPNAHHYVEVEFTRPQPGYWGVYFPSQGQAGTQRHTAAQIPPRAAIEAPRTPANPPAALAAKPVEIKLDSKELKPAKAPAPFTRAPAPKPVSTFVSLGTKEEVQPPAAATSEPRLSKVVRDIAAKSLTAEEPAESVEAPVQSKAAASAELGLSPEDTSGAAANLNMAGENAGEFGEFFGERSRFASATAGPAELYRRQNWMLIAAGVAILFTTVAAGAWFFHARTAQSGGAAGNPSTSAASPAEPKSATPQAVVSAEPQVALGARASERNAPVAEKHETEAGASLRAATPAGEHVPSTSVGAVENANRGSAEHTLPSAIGTSAAARSQAPGKVLSAAGLKAHPLSSQRPSDSANQAPAIDMSEASQLGNVSIPGSSALRLPSPGGDQPVRVGGAVTQPRLLASVMPVYPLAAKMAHVEGDVIINAQITKNGSVGRTTVVSGPAILRQAALEALRGWRYAPSELDGHPSDAEILVKIQFRL